MDVSTTLTECLEKDYKKVKNSNHFTSFSPCIFENGGNVRYIVFFRYFNRFPQKELKKCPAWIGDFLKGLKGVDRK